MIEPVGHSSLQVSSQQLAREARELLARSARQGLAGQAGMGADRLTAVQMARAAEQVRTTDEATHRALLDLLA
ncbi:MAG: hypothetical protein VX705_04300 [Verrucomicrobiota bacterium]|nr:hypothetical protein [Verrucomicrobiota bacterium]